MGANSHCDQPVRRDLFLHEQWPVEGVLGSIRYSDSIQAATLPLQLMSIPRQGNAGS